MSNITYADVKQIYGFYVEHFIRPQAAALNLPETHAALRVISRIEQQIDSYVKTGAPIPLDPIFSDLGVLQSAHSPDGLLSSTLLTVLRQINGLLDSGGQPAAMPSVLGVPAEPVVAYFYGKADAAVRDKLLADAQQGNVSGINLLKAIGKEGVLSGQTHPAAADVVATASAWATHLQPDLNLFLPDITGDSLDFLTAIYIGSFGRAPEHDGLKYWAAELVNLQQNLNAREALVAVAGRIYDAGYKPGSGTETGGNLDATGYVALLYQNVLGRDVTGAQVSAADAQGRDYWVRELDSGVDRSTFLHRFLEAALGKSNPDKGFIEARVLVAKYVAQASISGEGKPPTDLKAVIRDVSDLASAQVALTKLLDGGFGVPAALAQAALGDSLDALFLVAADAATASAQEDGAEVDTPDGAVTLLGESSLPVGELLA